MFSFGLLVNDESMQALLIQLIFVLRLWLPLRLCNVFECYVQFLCVFGGFSSSDAFCYSFTSESSSGCFRGFTRTSYCISVSALFHHYPQVNVEKIVMSMSCSYIGILSVETQQVMDCFRCWFVYGFCFWFSRYKWLSLICSRTSKWFVVAMSRLMLVEVSWQNVNWL